MSANASAVNQPCKLLVVAVTGSVGAAEIPGSLWYLQEQFAADVQIIMTKAATKFVTPYALQLVSRRRVLVDQFEDNSPWPVPHIQLAEQAELLLVMPASANILAKAAHGICDDLVSTTILCFDQRVVFVPNMNEVMWHNPIVQQNAQKLLALGRYVIEPTRGREVSSGERCLGGMPPIETITDCLKQVLSQLRGSGTMPPNRPENQ